MSWLARKLPDSKLSPTSAEAKFHVLQEFANWYRSNTETNSSY